MTQRIFCLVKNKEDKNIRYSLYQVLPECETVPIVWNAIIYLQKIKSADRKRNVIIRRSTQGQRRPNLIPLLLRQCFNLRKVQTV